MMLTTGFVIATQRHAEPGFFEFALLGPSMKASDYPSDVVVTQPITLLVFVVNRMAEIERIRITMRIGNADLPTERLAVATEQQFELESQEELIATFRFTLSQFGFTQNGSYRVVFELYRSTTDPSNASSWSFTGLWLQIWLNARE